MKTMDDIRERILSNPEAQKAYEAEKAALLKEAAEWNQERAAAVKAQEPLETALR